jgi:hypothetical protein
MNWDDRISWIDKDLMEALWHISRDILSFAWWNWENTQSYLDNVTVLLWHWWIILWMLLITSIILVDLKNQENSSCICQKIWVNVLFTVNHTGIMWLPCVVADIVINFPEWLYEKQMIGPNTQVKQQRIIILSWSEAPNRINLCLLGRIYDSDKQNCIKTSSGSVHFTSAWNCIWQRSVFLFWLSITLVMGRTIAEVVSRWFPTAAARVHAWVWQVAFVVDQLASGLVLSKYFGFPCQNRSFHQLLHHQHNHPGQLAEALRWADHLSKESCRLS